MRGEHTLPQLTCLIVLGDHPRMRGEHPLRYQVAGLFFGIIPACAGSTEKKCTLRMIPPGSSPHARGAPLHWLTFAIGSEDHPRMRGEHLDYLVCLGVKVGIIPACAGSTPSIHALERMVLGSSPHARGAPTLHLRRKHSGWDHPRMRGEHHSGKHRSWLPTGIIPACAGST